jgi:hypothetical protein
MLPQKTSPTQRSSKLLKRYEQMESYYDQISEFSPAQEPLLKLLEKSQSATDFMSAIMMRPWSIPEEKPKDTDLIFKKDPLDALKRLLKVSLMYIIRPRMLHGIVFLSYSSPPPLLFLIYRH